jgi:nicotinic acid mononucleotide adenylyltransferase
MDSASRTLLVAGLVAGLALAQGPGTAEARPGRLARAWQQVALNVGQAARQARAVAKNRAAEPSRWKRARTSVRAAAASLGIRRPPPVLLYQGAFDPVHRGHLTNLTAALAGVKGVAQVYVVPTSIHPGKTPVAYRHRVAMLKAALASEKLPSRVQVTVVDDPHLARLSMEGFNDLTGMIHNRHPGAPVYIMTGSDAYLKAAAQGLVSQARRWGYRYAVTPREGYPLPEKLPVGVEVMPISGGGESGTQIRRALAAQRVPQGTLDPSTVAYIRSHGLYGLGQGGAR